jgi:transcription elongation factor
MNGPDRQRLTEPSGKVAAAEAACLPQPGVPLNALRSERKAQVSKLPEARDTIAELLVARFEYRISTPRKLVRPSSRRGPPTMLTTPR